MRAEDHCMHREVCAQVLPEMDGSMAKMTFTWKAEVQAPGKPNVLHQNQHTKGRIGLGWKTKKLGARPSSKCFTYISLATHNNSMSKYNQ